MYRRILVATDGEPGALGALRIARELEQRRGSRVEVVAVCDPGDLYRMPASGRPDEAPLQLPRTALDMAHERARAQLAQLGSAALTWPVTVERGATATTILRVAARSRSTLVLMGMSPPPDPRESWFGRETLQKVTQMAHVPVCAVGPGCTGLPHRVLVALDFSRFSLRAAWEVTALLAPGAELHLAHVLPEPAENGNSWDHGVEWAHHYRPAVERRLAELAAGLKGVAEATPCVHELQGEPAHALLALAERTHADLLALGSHGHGYMGRLAAGTTASRLIRGADCSLLVVPPTGIPAEISANGASAEPAAGARQPAAGSVPLPPVSPAPAAAKPRRSLRNPPSSLAHGSTASAHSPAPPIVSEES